MIKETRQKLFSFLTITYAFTSLSVHAKNTDILYEGDDSLGKGDIRLEAEQISYIRNREDFLESDFEDGSVLSWNMKNTFKVFEGGEAPFGFNEKGLTIKGIPSEENTYATDSEDISIKSNVFTAWALSKYDSIEEVENAIQNIVLIKENNDLNLDYVVSDRNGESIVLKAKDGNLYKV